MKSKFLSLLFILLPIGLFAQNYEKEGDDLFAQAQYEQAEKKYKAAIAVQGESQTIKQKQEKCVKCKSLLTKAQTAEKESRYSDAAKHYSDLYAIHALPKYQSKVNAMKQKVQELEQQRLAKIEAERRAEQERQAEQDRLAKERAEKERVAREQAEQERLARERAEQERREDGRQWVLTQKEASLVAYKKYAQTYNAHIKEAESIISEMEEAGATYYYYIDGMQPQGHKVFYETFLQHPCGNKAMSWKYSISKLKGIAKKEKMFRSSDYNDMKFFMCTRDYRGLNVANWKDPKLIVYWKGHPFSFFGANIELIVSRYKKIGVKWERKLYETGYKWTGTYQYEGQTIFIELTEKGVDVYVKK